MMPNSPQPGFSIMPFSKNLVAHRKAAQMTQKQLAEALGVSIQQVKNYEVERNQPTLDVIKRMAVALNVTADALIFDEGERQPKSDTLRILVSTISEFPDEEQKTVISMLDAIVKRHRLSEMMQTTG